MTKHGASRLKVRAPRLKVLIPARVRISAGWNDACILNISERGLMIRAASAPPRRGSCVELRRGARIIIGRVMWAEQDRVGLATQDVLDVESIIAVPDEDTARAGSPSAIPASFDRRATGRPAAAFDRSRHRSRAFDFACLTIFAVAGCVVAFGAVTQLLAAPMAAVEFRLGAQRS
jgi:hypothetical protein